MAEPLSKRQALQEELDTARYIGDWARIAAAKTALAALSESAEADTIEIVLRNAQRRIAQ